MLALMQQTLGGVLGLAPTEVVRQALAVVQTNSLSKLSTEYSIALYIAHQSGFRSPFPSPAI